MTRVRALIVFIVASLSACGLDVQGTADAPSDGGGAGGVGGSGGLSGTAGVLGVDAAAGFDGGGDDAAATLPYGYRRRIHIEVPSSGLPAGLTLSFDLDHAALVALGKSKADGSDVRVLWRDGDSLVEVERAPALGSSWTASPTEIEFPLMAPAAAPADESYYLYYGDEDATVPSEDRTKIYLFWDDFEDGTLDAGWTLSMIGSASGSVNEDAGKLHLEAQCDDIWNAADDFVLLSRELSGDFVADSLVTASGGSLGSWAKVGGVMLRQSLDASAQNRIASPVNGAVAFTNSYRLAPGANTEEQTVAGPNPIPELARLTRRGDTSRAWYSADGTTWEQVGNEVSFAGLADPVRVGIPLANRDSGSLGWVDVEWFRVRRLSPSKVDLSLEPEEPGPFSR